MEAQSPRISVVVPTRNRGRTLARLIDALDRQTLPRSSFEVVIVDDGSVDDTLAVLGAAEKRASGPFRWIRRAQSRGPATARNAGWRASLAPVVAFTDDDCEPEAGWLEAGLDEIGRGPGLVMGRTRAREDAPGYGLPFSRTMEGVAEDAHYPTCNMFYSRAALEHVGGFDEAFRYACAEDTDLAWRAKAAGFRSTFCADAVVVHDVRPPSFVQFLRERPRFADQVRLVTLHPELRSRLYYRRYFYRRSHLHAMVTVVLAIASMVAWPVLLLLPVVWYDRLRRSSIVKLREGRALTAVQLLVADLWELAVFAYCSFRYRTVLL